MSKIQRLSQTLSKARIASRATPTIAYSAQKISTSSCHSEQQTHASASSSSSTDPPNTHYKITLMRSAISLGDRKKATLTTLGIHRRMQTVYHPHSPEFAGKILAVKELVKVENVPESAVRTKTEQRWERKASRGFVVVGGLKDRDLGRVGSAKIRVRKPSRTNKRT